MKNKKLCYTLNYKINFLRNQFCNLGCYSIKMIINKNKILNIAIIIVALFCVSLVVITAVDQNKPGEIVIKKEKQDFFKDIVIEAKSAYVWDVREEKILFAKNEEVQLPLASITKLMTAYIASEMVPENTIISINEDDLEVEGENGLVLGEKWNIKDILDLTLITSSNDGAHALASVVGFLNQDMGVEETEKVFVKKMNEKAEEMGLVQTFFLNESGLDLNEKLGGAYGSAKDVVVLMEGILENKPEILEATKYHRLTLNSKSFIYDVENTNQDVNIIPGVIGSKTGFTDLAGGNLVVAIDVGIGHKVIIAVLGSSKEGRFIDVRKLANATINEIGN